MKGARGVVLFECMILLELLVLPLFFRHLASLRHWHRQLEELQRLRLRYDGVSLYRPEVGWPRRSKTDPFEN